MKFNIYAGMSGGFGGATYVTTDDFVTAADAQEYAYQCALDDYQSYEGMHGILSWADCLETLKEEYNDDDVSYDDVDDYYQNEIESWIEYYIEPYEEGTNPEEE